MKKRKLSKERIVMNNNNEVSSLGKNKVGIFVVGGIILIMIVSVFAFSLSGGNANNEQIDFNGFEFTYSEGGWIVNIDGTNYGFEYSPVDVEMIESLDLSNEQFGDKVYLIFDPDEFSENSLELTRLRQFLFSRGIFSLLACNKEEGCGNIPIVDCNKINKGIYLRESNNTLIYRENNCIVLGVSPGEENLVINKFMYEVLGIM